MSPFRPSDLVPPEIAALRPYQAPEGEPPVRLDANESPFSLPPELAGEVREAVTRIHPNRYPDPASRALRRAFASLMGLPPGRVMAGNGSDELISLLFAAFRRPPLDGGRPVVLIPAPTFAMYALSGQAAGFEVRTVPLLLPDLTLDLPAFLAEVGRSRPNLVFLAQPNNPTGTQHPAAAIEAVLAASPGLVVVDEAYGDFSGEASWTGRLSEFPNLAVLRTLSKVGGAAFRCGFLAAREEVLAEVEKVRGPFNVNAFTQAAGERILAHPRFIAEQGRALAAAREALAAELSRRGVRVYPSGANFLLVQLGPRGGGREAGLHGHLAAGGVAVKLFRGLPVVGDALRITVGSPEEMRALLARWDTF